MERRLVGPTVEKNFMADAWPGDATEHSKKAVFHCSIFSCMTAPVTKNQELKC